MTEARHIRPHAYNLIRPGPLYRREAFDAGLRAVGYDVVNGLPERVHPDHLLVIWNRYGSNHDLACRFERAGASVIVAENGYLGPGGMSPHQMHPRQIYALGRGWHNDAAVIPTGGPERWNALGVVLRPWRTAGRHILILPNRSFGAPGRAMPPDWANDVRRRLLKLTKREVRLRPHPGNDAPHKPLADDLRDCWAAVIWSSSAGVHSLIAGVPVICCAPYWIAKGAAGDDLAAVENPPMADRLPTLERLAWAQFDLKEIESGEGFRAILALEMSAT